MVNGTIRDSLEIKAITSWDTYWNKLYYFNIVKHNNI